MYRNNYGEFPLRKMSNEERKNPQRNEQWYIQNEKWGRSKKLSREYWVIWEFYWTVSGLEPFLSPYLSWIPTDPSKHTRVCITWNCFTHFTSKEYARKAHKLRAEEQKLATVKGEYMYRLQRDKNAAMLIAKAETAEWANYVVVDTQFDHRNNFNGAAINYWPFNVISRLEKLYFCNSIEKVDEGKEYFTLHDWQVECAYSREEQLYYIVKME